MPAVPSCREADGCEKPRSSGATAGPAAVIRDLSYRRVSSTTIRLAPHAHTGQGRRDKRTLYPSRKSGSSSVRTEVRRDRL